jgi:hypothetical protein
MVEQNENKGESMKTGLVESVIDQMVAGDTDAESAVSTILRGGSAQPDLVEMDVQSPSCPECEGTSFEETELEGLPAIVCKECGTGYVPEAAVESALEDDEDGDLVEAEIDEEDPRCPVCESDNLDGEIVEDDGEEVGVVVCGDCNNVFLPVGQDEEE